jgi:MoxR-like ATPase
MQAEHWPTIRAEINGVRVEDGVLGYIMQIVRATREHRAIALGASPRAGIALLRGSKALSAIRGKGYITPDEVQTLVAPVLRHRLILTPESELEGGSLDEIIAAIVGTIPVPR